MSIHFIDRKGASLQLSARMKADLECELHRIGESPFPQTVRLWILDQTPQGLLEILKRIPDRPGDGNLQVGLEKLPDSEIPVPGNPTTGSAVAIITTEQFDGAVAGYQVKEPKSDAPAAGPPREPESSAGGWNWDTRRWDSDRVYNSVYQRETGHIFASPFGDGVLALRDGRIVNLRDEQDEMERQAIRDGRNDEGDAGGSIGW